MLGKKMCVEYWGSDIRVGEMEAADNPLYAEVMRNAGAMDKETSLKSSRDVQALFQRYGARVILPCPSMLEAAALPDVEEIQRAGAHADEDFARLQFRIRRILVPQHFGTAMRPMSPVRSWRKRA